MSEHAERAQRTSPVAREPSAPARAEGERGVDARDAPAPALEDRRRAGLVQRSLQAAADLSARTRRLGRLGERIAARRPTVQRKIVDVLGRSIGPIPAHLAAMADSGSLEEQIQRLEALGESIEVKSYEELVERIRKGDFADLLSRSGEATASSSSSAGPPSSGASSPPSSGAAGPPSSGASSPLSSGASSSAGAAGTREAAGAPGSALRSSSADPVRSGAESKEGTYGNQEIWSRGEGEAKARAAAMIRDGRPFPEILEELRRKRQEIARAQESEEVEKFGRPRLPWKQEIERDEGTDAQIHISSYLETYGEKGAAVFRGARTPMGGRYQPEGLAGKKAWEERKGSPPPSARGRWGKRKKPDFRAESAQGSQVRTFQVGWPGETLSGFRSLGTIGGRIIELTGSVFADAEVEGDRPVGMWLHTDPANIPKILAHVAKLHAKMMSIKPKARGARERILTLLGRSTWWLCHAMPFARGSASIVEWYVSAVQDHLGLHLGKMSGSVDLASFRLSEAQFVAEFMTFFEGAAEPAEEKQ